MEQAVGDEGGFAPNLPSNEAALEVVMEAIKTGYTAGKTIYIALDCAASEFYKGGKYVLEAEASPSPPTNSPTSWPTGSAAYPIVSIEDGMDESDLGRWGLSDQGAGQEGATGRRRFVRHNTSILKRGIDQAWPIRS